MAPKPNTKKYVRAPGVENAGSGEELELRADFEQEYQGAEGGTAHR